MLTRDLDYDLPGDLVAVHPAEPRDAARLLVYERATGAIEHAQVRDLARWLGEGDLLVVNDTAVAPARLAGRREDSGGRVGGLYLGAVIDADADEVRWRCMLRANGRLREGVRIRLGSPAATTGELASPEATIEVVARDGGAFVVRPLAGGRPVATEAESHRLLAAIGRTPLPPYILRARRERGEDEDDPRDEADYQTVYADPARRGSVAAPTAGLHFTEDLLARLAGAGVRRTPVTLHVGAGTFQPVEAEDLAEHDMHAEWFEVAPPALAALADASVRRRIAVGTTSVRTLESLPAPLPDPAAGPVAGETDLLIAPGHRWRHVDAMITNFHLPRSTLLALVAAFTGLDEMHRIYRTAVAERYRFYSYGDAMLLL